MKPTHATVKIDGAVRVDELAGALATINCEIRSLPDGALIIQKRRIRKPAPKLAVVEAKKPHG